MNLTAPILAVFFGVSATARAGSVAAPEGVSEEPDIQVSAYWEPFGQSKYHLEDSWPELKGLKPVAERVAYSRDDFAVFVPPPDAEVGDIWSLEESGVLQFLRQFHSGATLRLHHGFGAYEGAKACLAGIEDQYLDVHLRIHAEFVLSDGRSTLTPAQFRGRVVFERDEERPQFFRLYLPVRKTNVDVNWFRPSTADGKSTDGTTFYADIGLVPRMELVGGQESSIAEIAWSESISEAATAQSLARHFYEFAEIPWLPFDLAVAESQKSGKPLHVIVLFGALDDESC